MSAFHCNFIKRFINVLMSSACAACEVPAVTKSEVVSVPDVISDAVSGHEFAIGAVRVRTQENRSLKDEGFSAFLYALSVRDSSVEFRRFCRDTMRECGSYRNVVVRAHETMSFGVVLDERQFTKFFPDATLHIESFANRRCIEDLTSFMRSEKVHCEVKFNERTHKILLSALSADVFIDVLKCFNAFCYE